MSLPPARLPACLPPLPPSPQKFSLLGSTGSIGTQTLDIVAEHPDKFAVTALAAGGNLDLLAAQIRQFQPALVSVRDGSKVVQLKELIRDAPRQPEIMVGEEGICAVAAHAEADACVTGIVGCAGLRPTVAAIESGKDICLANKETLIAGGPFVLPLAKKHGVNILPADSEHSAIFQCLQVCWLAECVRVRLHICLAASPPHALQPAAARQGSRGAAAPGQARASACRQLKAQEASELDSLTLLTHPTTHPPTGAGAARGRHAPYHPDSQRRRLPRPAC